MPIASLATLATGARQLVVHDALDTTWWLSLSYWSKLTPRTTVTSGSVAGAEMMTFLAPASRCLAASARLVKKPVDSTTTSTPRSPQGSAPGSRSASTFSGVPSTTMLSPETSTVPGYGPRIESYFTSWASVSVSVRSLTATHSMSAPLAWAARKRLRPMRPKPLIPTRTGMLVSVLPEGRRSGRRRTLSVRLGSVPARDDLDPRAVGVQHVGRVIARPVLRAQARSPVVLPTCTKRGGVRRVDRDAPRGPDRDVAEAGPRRPVALDDPEARLVAAVGDRGLRLVDAPDAEPREQRVVEPRGA